MINKIIHKDVHYLKLNREISNYKFLKSLLILKLMFKTAMIIKVIIKKN